MECITGHRQAEPIMGEGNHWHFHEEMELTLFVAGAGTRFVGDQIEAFVAGDLVILGSNLPHYWHVEGVSQGVSVQWHFPPGHPLRALPEMGTLGELSRRANRGMRLCGKTSELVARMLKKIPTETGMGQLALFIRVLGVILEAPEADLTPLSERTFSLQAESIYQPAIARAVSHLAANFRYEIRLEDVLALTHLSRPTFSRQFKKYSGRTFSELLNGLRLEAACRELLKTDRSILDIALGCGFTQVSFFNRLFRRQMNCSPSQYRAQQGS
ncbi:MAG: helix-turn-helix transcriptional regulator [Gloeobacteraceae cyanobacterium ES-bin-144]|nr:helix-turn-helix transcriptional regulator [Verrucomicrobiales bacterium]